MRPIKAITAFLAAGWRAAKAVVWTGEYGLPNLLPLGASAISSAFGWGQTTYRRLATLAAESPYAARGLRLIADNAAAAPLVLMRRSGEEEERVTDDATLRRLQDDFWGTLCEAAVWAVHCGGTLFVERVGPTTGPNAVGLASTASGLRFWRPDQHRQTIRDEAGNPVRYQFSGYRGRTVSADAADVVELTGYNPLADVGEDFGVPILLSACRALVAMEKADAWNASLSASGGRLEGIAKPDPKWLADLPGGAVPKDVLARVQKDGDERFGESRKKGKIHFTSGAFDIQMLGMTPKDADFLKATLKDARATAVVLGVPPTLLGDEKGGSLTDAGVDSEVRALWLLTILPFLRRYVLPHLSRFLFGDGLRLEVDEAQITALTEDQDALWRRVGAAYRLHRIITREEAREYLDRPPEPDLGTFETEAVPPTDPAAPADSSTEAPEIRFLRSLSPVEYETGLQRLAA